MNNSAKKSYFGKLLEAYRDERGLSQAELRRRLAQMGYQLSHSAISQYERGEHRPSPKFIYLVSLCMALSQDETNALAEIALADMNLEFLSEYRDEWKYGIKGRASQIAEQGSTRLLKNEKPRDLLKKPKIRPPLKIFLCHSSDDKPAVRDLYQQLLDEGYDPWLDEEHLLPGQDWAIEIEKAVHAVDIVLVCLSHSSVTKSGFVQKEIRYALDIADTKPDGTIFIIPVRLEECNTPDRLKRLEYVNLFEERGYERLKLALQARAKDNRKN